LWQQTAYEWCIGNPSRLLVFTSAKPRHIFHISKRGEYIEIALLTDVIGGVAMHLFLRASPRWVTIADAILRQREGKRARQCRRLHLSADGLRIPTR
jgi:hypothetical protein